MKRVLWTVLVPVIILAAAVAVTGLLLAKGRRPMRTPARAAAATTVSVIEVEPGPVPYSVTLVGEVSAQRDVEIGSEVSGVVEWVLPDLYPGMRVSAGTVVARLDVTGFEASVAQARSTLADAEQALELEEGQGSAAALAASLVGPLEGARDPLVRRAPQLAAARASVAAAEASLADAERKLSLTVIRAPFDAILAEESLDPGRIVSSGSVLGRWIGTARAEIEVAVPLSALPRLENAEAQVRTHGGQGVRVADRISPTGMVDATTRTARVVLGVDQPFSAPALLPGSFVDVRLVGEPIQDAAVLPVEALVGGAAVWGVDDDSTLRKVAVEVLWYDGGNAVVAGRDGLTRVVARPTGTLLNGQVVQVRGLEG